MNAHREREPRLAGDGILMIPAGEGEEKFGSVYRGYFPACRFTALARVGETWYAAGNDSAGIPRLFSSESGAVWTERNMEASFGTLRPKDYGTVVLICPGMLRDELLLLCSEGVAVSVPDCPRCVEAARFSDEPVTDPRREGDRIRWKTAGGEEKSAGMENLVRHRVSWDWVIRHRAAVFCLYPDGETDPPRIPRAVPVPEAAFEALARSLPRETYAAVMHPEAGRADAAAVLARKAGLENCRSMGSLREALTAETTEE